jgi:hypothetical protein
MENKYFDITMDEVYDLLTHHKNPWPANFSKVRKLQLLDNIIEYYQEQELFERCVILTKLREAVLSQSIKQKTKRTGG